MKTYAIEGMTCQGCVRSLTRAVERRLGESAAVEVRFPPGELVVPDDVKSETVREMVESAGFSVQGA